MKHQREHWASRLGLIMAAIGSAIGLGTLWQFPYVTGSNGGGLFVLIYLGATLVIGVPVFMAELMLGRRAQRGVVGTFSSLSHGARGWRTVGWMSALAPILILSYYHVVAGWGLNYIFLSLSQFSVGKSPEAIRHVFEAMVTSGDVCVLFQALFTAIVFGMVAQGVQKGIEYWAKVMTIGLFVLLLGLLAYSITLDGFGDAVRFIFKPEFGKLKPSGILRALGLSLFTLSLGHGVMVTYGSYMKRNDDIPKVTAIVVTSDIIISLLAALMIFPIIFTFGFQPDQGAGLIFQTLPVLFEQLPGSVMISTAFFVLFVFTALTSAIAMLEVITANLMDLYQWTRKRAALLSAGLVFVLGLPSALSRSGGLFRSWSQMYDENFFGTINDLVSTWLLPVVALLTSIFAGWVVKKSESREEFQTGTKWGWIFPIWRFFVRWVVPVAIVIVILQESGIVDLDKLIRL